MGRADIVEDGGYVEGKVYEIPKEALKYLYRREGAPYVYRPTFVEVEVAGKKVQALTFVVKNKLTETAPPPEYEEEILRGGRGFLSEVYLNRLKDQIDSLKMKSLGGR